MVNTSRFAREKYFLCEKRNVLREVENKKRESAEEREGGEEREREARRCVSERDREGERHRQKGRDSFHTQSSISCEKSPYSPTHVL